MFCNKIRNILNFPGTQMNTNYMDACTQNLTSVEWALSPKIYSLVEPSQGRITLGNLRVSEIAMEQKKKRVATKQYKDSPSLLQQSSTATIQAWQERESLNLEAWESVR